MHTNWALNTVLVGVDVMVVVPVEVSVVVPSITVVRSTPDSAAETTVSMAEA